MCSVSEHTHPCVWPHVHLPLSHHLLLYFCNISTINIFLSNYRCLRWQRQDPYLGHTPHSKSWCLNVPVLFSYFDTVNQSPLQPAQATRCSVSDEVRAEKTYKHVTQPGTELPQRVITDNIFFNSLCCQVSNDIVTSPIHRINSQAYHLTE